MVAGRSDLELHVATTADGKGLTKAADQLDDTTESSDDLGASFKATGKESKALDAQTEELTDHIHELGIEFDRTAAKTDKAAKSLRDLGDDVPIIPGRITKGLAELGDEGGDSVRRVRREIVDLGSDMATTGAAAARLGSGVAAGLGDLASSTGAIGQAVMAGLIVGLVEAAVIAGPAIGAMLAGSVAGLGGTLGVAGGVIAAFQSPGVKEAAAEMGSAIGDVFVAAGAGLVPEVIKSLSILRAAFSDLNLAHSFELAAPSIELVAEGIADLARNFMPGFNKMLERATPFAVVFAAGMGDIGTALGNFFDKSSRSEGALAGLQALFDFLAATITTTGTVLEWFSDRYMDMLNMIEDTTRFIGDAADALGEGGLGGIFHGLSQMVTDFKDRMPSAMVTVLEFGAATLDTSKDAERLADALAASNKEFDKMFGIAMSVDEANLALKRGLMELKEEFKKGKVDWRESTDEGLKHRQMLLDQVQALKDKRDADIAAGDGSEASIKKANAAYDKGIKKLEEMADAAGASADVIADLAGTYKVEFIFRQTAVGKQVMAWSTLRNQERQSEVPVTVPVTIYGGGKAAGGTVMAGVSYDINENAKERVTFPANGMVHPANLSPVSGGSQMSARPAYFTGSMEHLFFSWFSEQVQARGGTLAVLGIRD
jgi:hypothetical protein